MDFCKAEAGFYLKRVVFEAHNCADNFCPVLELQLIGKCFERHQQGHSRDKGNPEPHDSSITPRRPSRKFQRLALIRIVSPFGRPSLGSDIGSELAPEGEKHVTG